MKILSIPLFSLIILGASSCSWIDEWTGPAEPGLNQAPRDYHDDDYWTAHDIKFIALSIPPYTLHVEPLARFINRVKAAPVSKNSAKSQEEFSISGDGVAPAKRFVLDRKRQWLLVFEDGGSDTEANVSCYRRTKGQLKFYNKQTYRDLGLTQEEWPDFFKVSSDTIEKMGIFK